MLLGFSEIYQRYARDVHRFSLYLSGSSAEADDVTAETFARAFAGGDIRSGSVKSYLFTIARNVYRSRRRRATTPVDEGTADPRDGPEQHAANQESIDALLRALNLLSEVERVTLLMKVRDGMSYEEIASALGISVAAAKV